MEALVKSKIHEHPEREEIIRDCLDLTQTIRGVADKWGFSKSVVERFRKNTLGERLREQTELRHISTAETILRYVADKIAITKKLQRAIEKELADPENPGEYTLRPRAYDMEVIVVKYVDGKPKREVQNFQDLVDEVRKKNGGMVVSHKHRSSDPAELLLKWNNSNRGDLELLMKISESVRDSEERLVDWTSELDKFIKVINKVLKPYPNLRRQFADELRNEGLT